MIANIIEGLQTLEKYESTVVAGRRAIYVRSSGPDEILLEDLESLRNRGWRWNQTAGCWVFIT